jgi:hypothetical protein
MATFEPIPELARSDGDLTLIFLSANAVGFIQPTKDPWYAVSNVSINEVSYVSSHNQSEHEPSGLYYTTEPASPLACVEQYQWCNPSLPEESRCTNLLSGLDAASDGLRHLFNGSQHDMDRYKWYYYPLHVAANTLIMAMQNLGAQSMSSRSGLFQGLQGPLPDNQWQRDVSHWFSILLASIQNGMVITAMGPPPGQSLERWKEGPRNLGEENTCKNQVSHFLAHQSRPLGKMLTSYRVENQEHSVLLLQCLWSLFYLRCWRLDRRHILCFAAYPLVPPTSSAVQNVRHSRVVCQRDPSASAPGSRRDRVRHLVEGGRLGSHHAGRREASLLGFDRSSAPEAPTTTRNNETRDHDE